MKRALDVARRQVMGAAYSTRDLRRTPYGAPSRNYLGTLVQALAADAASGATTATLYDTPAFRAGAALAFSPYTTNCNIRRVVSITGNTVTLDRALTATHLAGSGVLVLPSALWHVGLFGAVGDGTTDDQPAIQAAVDDTGATITNGAKVYFDGQGNYGIAAPIVVNRHRVSLHFNEAKLTALAAMEVMIDFRADDPDDSLRHNKVFDCFPAGSPDNGVNVYADYCIRDSGTHHLMVDGLWASHFNEAFFHSKPQTDARSDSNWFWMRNITALSAPWFARVENSNLNDTTDSRFDHCTMRDPSMGFADLINNGSRIRINDCFVGSNQNDFPYGVRYRTTPTPPTIQEAVQGFEINGLLVDFPKRLGVAGDVTFTAADKSFRRTNGQYWPHFVANDTVMVYGSTSNEGNYTIVSRDDDVVVVAETVVDEVATGVLVHQLGGVGASTLIDRDDLQYVAATSRITTTGGGPLFSIYEAGEKFLIWNTASNNQHTEITAVDPAGGYIEVAGTLVDETPALSSLYGYKGTAVYVEPGGPNPIRGMRLGRIEVNPANGALLLDIATPTYAGGSISDAWGSVVHSEIDLWDGFTHMPWCIRLGTGPGGGNGVIRHTRITAAHAPNDLHNLVENITGIETTVNGERLGTATPGVATMRVGDRLYDTVNNRYWIMTLDGERREVVLASNLNLYQIYNVTQYGAAGNGTTDDTAAFQAAITAAGTAGGGLVHIPRGTFLVGTSTYVALSSNNIHVEGVGPGSVLKLANSSAVTGSQAMLYITGDGCSVRNLKLDGNRANQTNLISQVMFVGAERGRVTECLFVNGKNNGVYANTGSKGIAVANNEFIDNFGSCIRTGSSVEDVAITGNICRDETVDAAGHQDGMIAVRFAGSNITIANNTLRALSGTPISMLIWICAGNNISVTGNTGEGDGATTYAVFLHAREGTDLTDVSISGNTFRNTGSITAQRATTENILRLIASGNTLDSMGTYAIQLEPGANGEIAGNQIRTATTSTIAIRVATPNVVITGNRIVHRGTNHGIYVEGGNQVVTNNYVDINGATARCIDIWGDYNVVMGNRLLDSASNAIKEQGGSDFNAIVGNVSSGTLGYSITGANTQQANNV